MWEGDVIFLSHLCGGEVIGVPAFQLNLFLSHLCGGEDLLEVGANGLAFLSHLCGGEGPYY